MVGKRAEYNKLASLLALGEREAAHSDIVVGPLRVRACEGLFAWALFHAVTAARAFFSRPRGGKEE